MYPQSDDDASYPTKESLAEKLGKLTNSTMLLAFVKNIKEDLNESKIIAGQDTGLDLTPEEMRKALIITTSKKIKEIKGRKPTLINLDSNVDDVLEKLNKTFDDNVAELFELKNEIDDLAGGDGVYPKSAILKPNDFAQLKKWLPNDMKNKKFSLLYHGKKDGYTSQAFHQKCDN